MDGKRQLLAAIDNPNGIHDTDWMCIMPFFPDTHPIWEEIYPQNGKYFIPNKYKEQLKKEIMEPGTTITYFYDDEQDEDMSVLVDEDTIPARELRQRKAKTFFDSAELAYELGDLNKAFNDVEAALELDPHNNEYLSYSILVSTAIQGQYERERAAKQIDIATLKCGACGGPYSPETGHAFFHKKELKGVACGICAGKWFAKRMLRQGWVPKKLSKKQRRQRKKRLMREERERHLAMANQIIAEARSTRISNEIETLENEGGYIRGALRRGEYPYWPKNEI